MLEALGAVGLAVLVAVLAVATPRIWDRLNEARKGGALVYSLAVQEGPLVLYPDERPATLVSGSDFPPALPANGTAFGWQTGLLKDLGTSDYAA